MGLRIFIRSFIISLLLSLPAVLVYQAIDLPHNIITLPGLPAVNLFDVIFAFAVLFVGSLITAAWVTAQGGKTTVSSKKEMGTVKWFNSTKGFGFILRDQGDEIFAHYRAIKGKSQRGRRSLSQGQRVSFTVTKDEKGLQAENITVVKNDE